MNEKNKYKELLSQKDTTIQLLHSLLEVYEEERSIKSFLLDNEINTIALYGMGFLGKHVYKALNKEKVPVQYVIDRNAEAIQATGTVVLDPLKDFLPQVDAIIVTPIKYFYEVEMELYKIMPETHVVSIEQVLTYRRDS